MAYQGFLSLGGTEIANAARAATYANEIVPLLGVEDCWDCGDLAEALGDREYNTPLVDRPDWFDDHNPYSWEFCGLYPLEIEGLEDGTREATVTELSLDGAVVGAPRFKSREIRVSGLLIGASDGAVEYGMTWLAKALEGAPCRSGGEGCTGDHLCYYSSCPPMCTDSPALDSWPGGDVGPMTHAEAFFLCDEGLIQTAERACSVEYERTMYQVTMISGPTIVERYNSTCGSMVRVEFVLVAGVPFAFSTAISALPGAHEAPVAQVAEEIACVPGTDVVVRTNLATNPIPIGNAAGESTGWQADGTGFTVSASEVRRLIGDASVMMTRSEVTDMPNLAPNPDPADTLDGWSWALGQPGTGPERENLVTNPWPRTADGWTYETSTSSGSVDLAGPETYTNLNPNPSLETSLTGYSSSPSVTTIARDDAWAAPAAGDWSLKVSPTGAASVDTFGVIANTVYASLVPGTTYTVTATCHLVAPLVGALSGNARRIRAYWTASNLASDPAPNVAGDHVVSVTFTPTQAVDAIRLYNGAAQSERTNLAAYPFSNLPPEQYGATWGMVNRWFGGTTNTGTHAVVSGATDGPVPELTQYIRKTWTAVAETANDIAMAFTGPTGFAQATPVTAGQTYRFGYYWRPSWDLVATRDLISVAWYDADGNSLGTANGPDSPSTKPAGQWQRTTATFTVPEGAVRARVVHILYLAENVPPIGGYIDFTGVLVEESPVGEIDTYFDGNTPDTVTQGNFAWSGAAGASTSMATVLNPMWWDNIAIVEGSTPMQFTGDSEDTDEDTFEWTGTPHASTSTRLTSGEPGPDGQIGFARVASDITADDEWSATYAGDQVLTDGVTYSAGVFVRTTTGRTVQFEGRSFDLPPYSWQRLTGQVVGDGGPLTLTVSGVGRTAGGELDLARALVEEGAALGGYFDGSFPDAQGYTFTWTGEPDASTSTSSLLPISVDTELVADGSGPGGQESFQRTTIVNPKAGGEDGPRYVWENAEPGLYTYDLQVRSTQVADVTLRIVAFDADGVVLGSTAGQPVVLQQGEWTHTGPVTYLSPEGTARVQVTASFPGQDVLGAGESVDAAAMRVVEGLFTGTTMVGRVTFVGQHDDAIGTIDANAGAPFVASLYAAASVSGTAHLELEFYNSAGTLLDRVVGEPRIVAASPTPVASASWRRVNVVGTAPSGAAAIVVSAQVDSFQVAQPGDRGWVTEVLVEQTTRMLAYFDGSMDPVGAVTYEWTGTENASTSQALLALEPDPTPIIDPDCPVVPDPPRPPVIALDCVDTPTSWRRYVVDVHEDLVPVWRDAVPLIRLTTGSTAARQVRLRFYPNPLEVPLEALNPCEFCGEFVITYIPPRSEMFIDGIRQWVTVTDNRSGRTAVGNHLLSGSGGGPATWPLLGCGTAYTLVIDVSPTGVSDLEPEICLAARA